MIRIFKLIVDDLRHGENLDIYSTVIVAIVVAALGVAGVVRFEIISAAILAILSLLSISLLVGRRTADELKKLIRGSAGLCSVFSEKAPDLSEEFQAASRISILGTSLSSTVQRHYSALEQALERGCQVRILKTNPTPDIVRLLAYRSYWAHDPSVMEQNLRASMFRVEKLGRTPNGPELLELRVVQHIPSCGMVLVERNDGVSRLFVKIMSFRTEPTVHFELSSQVDDKWFKFFSHQFEELWKVSTPVSVSNEHTLHHAAARGQ